MKARALKSINGRLIRDCRFISVRRVMWSGTWCKYYRTTTKVETARLRETIVIVTGQSDSPQKPLKPPEKLKII
jgi:hypothetical protein